MANIKPGPVIGPDTKTKAFDAAPQRRTVFNRWRILPLDQFIPKKKPRFRSIRMFPALLVMIGAIAFGTLYLHRVDNALTAVDRQYIPIYLDGIPPLPAATTYADELAYITAVQRKVLDVSPLNRPIPYGQEREPKQLLLAKHGQCFDRSRTIEKILNYGGFKTRHVSMFQMGKEGKAIKSLITPQNPSHAVTEVLTRKGWMVVGSNTPWLSIDVDMNPYNMTQMQLNAGEEPAIKWLSTPEPIYLVPFTFVYGLYSRHGEFYPPYDFIPDINYPELLQNIFPGRT